MLDVSRENAGQSVTITGRANFSLGLKPLLAVILGLSLITLLFATVLAWQGYWPILLIALLQVVLVAWALFRAWRGAWALERIQCDGRDVWVRQRSADTEQRYHFDPCWCRVEISGGNSHREQRVWLCQHERRLELGRFLVEEERLALASALREQLATRSVWRAV